MKKHDWLEWALWAFVVLAATWPFWLEPTRKPQPEPSQVFSDGSKLWKLCDGEMGIFVIGKDESYKIYTWPGSCK